VTTWIVIIALVVALLAAVAVFAVVGRRESSKAVGRLTLETQGRDKQARKQELKARQVALAGIDGDATPAVWTPPTEQQVGIARRQFINRGIVTLFATGSAIFGLNVLRFLWPQGAGGFGSKISVGKISDILANIDKNNGFYYVPEGKMWITRYPAYALDKAKGVYAPTELSGMQAGVVALYQKCPHLGCRVPQCLTSKWFECPCHGSQYNQVGEKKGGPAPRGMDHFAMDVSGGSLTVDTGTVILGPAIGTDTTGQEAEGPHCV
jgi:cytochrome b6-f complex iron-sulfur subunit